MSGGLDFLPVLLLPSPIEYTSVYLQGWILLRGIFSGCLLSTSANVVERAGLLWLEELGFQLLGELDSPATSAEAFLTISKLRNHLPVIADYRHSREGKFTDTATKETIYCNSCHIHEVLCQK